MPFQKLAFVWTCILFTIGTLTGTALSQSGHQSDLKENWGHWRGPAQNGSSASARPPIQWSEQQNVKWKTPIRGLGHSSPVVWHEHVFLTSAEAFGPKFAPIADQRPGSHDNLKVSQKHRYLVIAIDRQTGKTLWEKKVHENVPHEGSHYSGSVASASPVTDGTHVYAHFGSHGLYCLDLKGNLVWKKTFEPMHTKHGHGEGSSPVLHGNTLVINWDHEGQSFVLAIDKRSGKELWKRLRDEVTSWSSPIVVTHKESVQLIVAGTGKVRSYDLKTGEVIWECGGLSANVCASPVEANGIVIVGSSYDTRAMFGIKLEGAKGNITGSENVLWFRNQRTPYVPSPLLFNGQVYFFRHYQGVLTQLDASTGEETSGPFRIRGLGEIYASPVAADDKIYMVGRSGLTVVMSQSEIPRVLSANRLEDRFSASPALAGKEIFLRGEKSLYCLQTRADSKR